MHVEYVFMYNCQLGLVGARQSASGEGKGEEKGGEQGKLLLSGRFVAAFSNEEEDELGLRERLPQLTEDAMDAQGAICVPAEPWYVPMYLCVCYPIGSSCYGARRKANVVVDGRLVTGQNPQSSLEALPLPLFTTATSP